MQHLERKWQPRPVFRTANATPWNKHARTAKHETAALFLLTNRSSSFRHFEMYEIYINVVPRASYLSFRNCRNWFVVFCCNFSRTLRKLCQKFRVFFFYFSFCEKKINNFYREKLLSMRSILFRVDENRNGFEGFKKFFIYSILLF